MRRHVPEALISAAAFDRVLDTTVAVPAGCAEVCYGFECPLVGESWADVWFVLPEAGRWIADLEGWQAPADGDQAAWCAWRRFAATWQPGPISVCGAEFDASGPRARTPALFWRFRPGTPRASLIAELDRLLEPERVANVARVVQDLPAGWRVTEVGAMLSRPGGVVRLNLTAPAEPFRVEARWLIPPEPDGARLQNAIERFASPFDHTRLALDVVERVRPTVGLELMPVPVDEPVRSGTMAYWDADRWRSILDGMVEVGLADPGRTKAALGYLGVTNPLRPPDLCPRSILAQWAADGFAKSPYLLRIISHLKVVFPAGSDPFAKIYPVVVPFWTPSADR